MLRSACGRGIVLTRQERNTVLQKGSDGRNAQNHNDDGSKNQHPCQNMHLLFQVPDLFFLRRTLLSGVLTQNRVRTAGNPHSCIRLHRAFFHLCQTFRAEHLFFRDFPAASHAIHAAPSHFYVASIVQQFSAFVKAQFRSRMIKTQRNSQQNLYIGNKGFTICLQNNLKITLDSQLTICYYHITRSENTRRIPL